MNIFQFLLGFTSPLSEYLSHDKSQKVPPFKLKVQKGFFSTSRVSPDYGKSPLLKGSKWIERAIMKLLHGWAEFLLETTAHSTAGLKLVFLQCSLFWYGQKSRDGFIPLVRLVVTFRCFELNRCLMDLVAQNRQAQKAQILPRFCHSISFHPILK